MSFLHQLRARIPDAVPILTMLGTFALAGLIYRQGDVGDALLGIAHGIPEALAAPESGRIAAVHVAVGTEVEPGQIVATLDTSLLESEIEIAEAEKSRLQVALHAEWTALSRRLDIDRETVEREAIKEREDLLRLNAEAKALDTEIARVERLVSEHKALASDLTPLKLRRAALTSVATEKPRTIGLLDKQLLAATDRKREVDDGKLAAARLEAELLVVQRRVELLEKRRSNHLLRATRRGRVASIEKQPGESATGGEPIVKLVSATNRVDVCVPERRALGLREGEVARVWLSGQHGSALAGRTIAIGSMVSELPARCWPAPNRPVWGREVSVELDAAIELVAGESFVVVLDGVPAPPLSPSSSVPATKAVGPSGPGSKADNGPPPIPEPRFMSVPPSLARRTRFEPSGIAVRPKENRYLVVSDDTGIKGGETDGRPWLFGMDASGNVDPEPTAIAGVRSVDDLEAIAPGDGDEIFVLSSQSHSRRDRRSHARSALLRLVPRGDSLVTAGEAHLAELLDRAPARAAALGLTNGTRDLDIEGMAFHEGALYLGVKAPLNALGNAMIWKVARPKALFDAASRNADVLEAAGLSTWADLRVDVEVDGKTLPGGISELLFWRGDALVVASTPSVAEGDAGALWHVEHAHAGGSLSPRLVRRFPGRKPEGLAPSLSPGKLMVVFDAGAGTPSFVELAWPP